MLRESEESVGDENNPHSAITGRVRIRGAYGYVKQSTLTRPRWFRYEWSLRLGPRPFFRVGAYNL